MSANWGHRFFENGLDLVEFLGSLSHSQASSAKVLPGKKRGYAIYGWDVFFNQSQIETADQSLSEASGSLRSAAPKESPTPEGTP